MQIIFRLEIISLEFQINWLVVLFQSLTKMIK